MCEGSVLSAPVGSKGLPLDCSKDLGFGSVTKPRERRGKLEAEEGLHPAKQNKTHEREMPPVLNQTLFSLFSPLFNLFAFSAFNPLTIT